MCCLIVFAERALKWSAALSEEMYDDGFTEIVNVDYSAVCIERMQELHSTQRPRMTCASSALTWSRCES